MGHYQIGGAVMVGAKNGRRFQPVQTPLGDCILFTGHIDNRDDLLHQLPDTIDPACDDTALYGHCHVAFGDACDLRLIGQYAAVLWSPARNEIRLARSPIDAPPLHIWQGENGVIIATTPRAIFATVEVEQEIDEQKIADSLVLNYAEAERGWFKGVSRLRAGNRAVINSDGMQKVEYYDPFHASAIRFGQDDDYVEAAKALFRDATKAALRGFSKPAISLSGGYDSQAVAAFALEAMPKHRMLKGFTSVPEQGWDGCTRAYQFGDERAYVEALAEMHPRLETAFVDSAGLSFDHNLNTMFLMAGAPPRNAMNLYWIHEARSRAKAAECDVMLTGALGNLKFSFYAMALFRLGSNAVGCLGQRVRDMVP